MSFKEVHNNDFELNGEMTVNGNISCNGNLSAVDGVFSATSLRVGDALITSTGPTVVFDSIEVGGSAPLSLNDKYEMVVDSQDWYGWETGEGPTADTALVVVGWSDYDGTTSKKSGWAWYTASETGQQSKYAYSKIKIPAYATTWNSATAFKVRCRTSTTDAVSTTFEFNIDNGSSQTDETVLSGYVSNIANEWTEFPILSSDVSWIDLTSDSVLNVVGGFYSVSGHYVQFPQVFANWGS